MFRPNSILALLCLAALLQTPALSQEASCLRRTLPLTLEDSQGVSIEGLRATDLQTSFRVAPVKILSIVPDDRPHRIVILVDASETMATKWREVLAPASDLAETALANTKMALLVFKDKITEQISFSEGRSAVAERLRQMRSTANASGQMTGGRTAIFDSLLAGLQLLETPSASSPICRISRRTRFALTAYPCSPSHVPVRRTHIKVSRFLRSSCWWQVPGDIVALDGVSHGLSQDLGRAVRGHPHDS